MKTDKYFNFLYAVGAAIVIFGCWQKILHKEMADTFLTIGLLTEVAIFIILGIQELFAKKVPEVSSYPKVEGVDNSELTQSVNELNKTIKQVFNR
jgi:hypothetical protein